MSNLFQYKLDLLKQEIDNLQNGIRGYDTVLLTVKGWTITIFSAVIFFAIDKQQAILFPFCAILVILFWLLDAFYRTIQGRLILRYHEIEKFLQSPEFDSAVADQSFGSFHIPNTYERFRTTTQDKLRAVIWHASFLSIAVPYGSMLITTIILGLIFF